MTPNYVTITITKFHTISMCVLDIKFRRIPHVCSDWLTVKENTKTTDMPKSPSYLDLFLEIDNEGHLKTTVMTSTFLSLTFHS